MSPADPSKLTLGYQRHTVFGPSGWRMGIDAFHVLLCGILPILVILSAVSEGVNVGGTIGLQLPCARQSDRRMQLF
jgi:hypothetical protein